MGEATKSPLRVHFDCRLKLEFRGTTITSDAGLLAFRELDDALGLTGMAASRLTECRKGKNTQQALVALLRQSIFGRLAGYEDVNDAERLRLDPAMRSLVGHGDAPRYAASTSEMARFETEQLATEENLEALPDLSGHWIDRVYERTALKDLVLDMDSSDSPTFGQQEGSTFNGHFGFTCYHPLFVFNQFGDLERAMLRPGNVHSSKGWREALEPVVARYRSRKLTRSLRADAAFARPEIYEFLEAEGFQYVIRLPANERLQEAVSHLLTRPVGRPPLKPQVFHASFRLQRRAGRSPAASSPRSSGTGVSSSPVWGSSSQISGGPPAVWFTSTISAALPSSGSRKESARFTGRSFPATGLGTTPCGSSYSLLPTILGTSCGHWRYQMK